MRDVGYLHLTSSNTDQPFTESTKHNIQYYYK